jgi:hypothetical protein
MIAQTVVIHAHGLGLIDKRAISTLHGKAFFGLALTRLLGAIPDNSSAMLYSPYSVTTYGHENLDLARR